MNATIPEFTETDVALLISAVEQSLQRLRDANERLGGNDREIIDYGTRYSVLLEKLKTIVPGR